MISDYERRRIFEQGSDACTRHLLRRTAALVNTIRVVGTSPDTDGPADSEVPGTGTPMKWSDHYFVLSARHVFDRAAAKDLRVATYVNIPLTYKDREALTMRDLMAGEPLTEDSAIHRCEWEDLALVTVDPKKFPGVEFVDPNGECVDPAVGKRVHCCGFPSDHSVMVNPKKVSGHRMEVEVAVWPTTFSGEVLPFPKADELKFKYPELDEERHYLIPYELPGVSESARGLSGAAVWLEAKALLVWAPNFTFAGVCTHWYPKRSRVGVVKASAVRRFLAEVFGALPQ